MCKEMCEYEWIWEFISVCECVRIYVMYMSESACIHMSEFMNIFLGLQILCVSKYVST